MSRIKITKSTVLKAIETEPLTSMVWCSLSDDFKSDLETEIRNADPFLGDYDLERAIERRTANIDRNTLVKKKQCRVCAVGSVFHNVMPSNVPINEVDDLASIVKIATFDGDYDGNYPHDVRGAINAAAELSERGLYLSALSCLFEFLMTEESERYSTTRGVANSRARGILLNFVKKHFPRSFVLDTKRMESY